MAKWGMEMFDSETKVWTGHVAEVLGAGEDEDEAEEAAGMADARTLSPDRAAMRGRDMLFVTSRDQLHLPVCCR